MSLFPRLNHVFVDFENVRMVDLDLIGLHAFKFMIFLGPQQTKLEVDLVERLMDHASLIRLIRLGSAGKNALDFTLAYYVGAAVSEDEKGFFHIISKDKGYDPMIEHLLSKKVRISRHDDFTSLRSLGEKIQKTALSLEAKAAVTTESKLGSERISLQLSDEDLGRAQKCLHQNRPKNKDKLINHLSSQLKLPSGSPLMSLLLQKLSRDGYLTITDKMAVTYHVKTS